MSRMDGLGQTWNFGHMQRSQGQHYRAFGLLRTLGTFSKLYVVLQELVLESSYHIPFNHTLLFNTSRIFPFDTNKEVFK